MSAASRLHFCAFAAQPHSADPSWTSEILMTVSMSRCSASYVRRKEYRPLATCSGMHAENWIGDAGLGRDDDLERAA